MMRSRRRRMSRRSCFMPPHRRQSHEPKAAVAHYDKKRDIYDVYVPTQGITMMRPGLASAVGVTEDKVKCIHSMSAAAFGVRSEPYAEYPVVMYASKLTGRPVKWVSTRTETMISDHHARAAKLSGNSRSTRTARCWACGRIGSSTLAAISPELAPFINTAGPSRHPTNIYTIPAFYGLHQLVLTNTTPTTAYRGAARPNVTYLVERLVDEAAREMGIDRIELRKRNLIPKKAFPYTIPTGAVYDSGDPPGLLADALKAADWKGFEKRRKQSAKNGKLRGISCCTFVEPSGGGVAPEDGMIKFGESGNPVLYTVSGLRAGARNRVSPKSLRRSSASIRAHHLSCGRS